MHFSKSKLFTELSISFPRLVCFFYYVWQTNLWVAASELVPGWLLGATLT